MLNDDPLTQKADMAFIKDSMAQPMLEKEYELGLAKRWREDKDSLALHKLVRSYTRLVVAMAHKFKHYGLPLGDLIQEGNIGLMEAANRFEYERELRFSTYASWWIRSYMQDYVLRNWSIVRTGTTSAHKSLFFNFRRLRAKIAVQEGDTMTDDARHRIAKELNVKYSDVVEMENRLSGADTSLNALIGGDDSDSERGDFLVDTRPNPEDIVMFVKDQFTRNEWLQNSLGRLNTREQHIIKMRSLCEEVVTLEALGRELGVSKERVRQLEARAMEKLKSSLLQQVGEREELFVGT
jgi:RNA polymerase sigma-32 factor